MPVTLNRLRRALPVLGWLHAYDRRDARGDLTAGLTVGVMLIPQGMAYAVLAGLPAVYGLYAAVAALLVYPLIGSSRHLATGPVAIDMLIVGAGVGGLAAEGTATYIELVALATAMVAVLHLLMGALRLGFLANLLSRPVITGFAAAAALIIVASQAGNLLGVELARSQHIHVVALDAAARVGETHWISVAIAAVSVIAIVGLRRWRPVFPAELAVIAGAAIAVWALDLEAAGVPVIGDVRRGLPLPGAPSFGLAEVRALLPTAMTLALVQFMGVVSLGRIYARRHRYAVDPNRELLAVGALNLAGSLFHCPPASGSYSRTAVNEQAGARTAFASIVAAAVVGLTLLFLTGLFHDVPMAALAAIIVVAAVGLIDVDAIRYLFRTKRVDGWTAVLTFGATLVLGVEFGLLLGIAAAVVAVLYRQSRPHVAELGHLASTRSFKNVDRFAKAHRIDDVVLLRIEAGFSFFNAEFLKDYILDKVAERGARAVVLDAGAINDLDTTAIAAVEEVAETLETRGVAIHFAALTGPVRDIMARSGFGAALGEDRFHLTPHRAVRHILGHWDEAEGTRRLEGYERSTRLDERQVEPTAGSRLT